MQGLKGIVLCWIVLIGFGGLAAQAPDWSWAFQAGGTDLDWGNSIAADNQGNLYVTGLFAGVAQFGSYTLTSSGFTDVFVIKLDGDGDVVWAVKAGGTGEESGMGIVLDSTANLYLTGYFEGTATFGSTVLTSNGYTDVYAAKLDSNGSFIWAVGAGGTEFDYGNGIAADNSGNAYLTGFFGDVAAFGSTILTSNGMDDAFAAKLSPNGSFLWARNAGGEGWDYGRGITVDGDSNVYLTGLFESSADFGSTSFTSRGATDVFAAKLDTNGNWLWAIQAGGTGYDESQGIAVDAAANVYLTGDFEDEAGFGPAALTSRGFLDIFVLKLDASGGFLWVQQAGGPGFDICMGIVLDSSASVFLTGLFDDTATFGATSITSQGNMDIFAAKLNGSGDFVWARQAGGTGYDTGYGIALDSSANVCLTGFFDTNAAFGSTNVLSNGIYDVYAAKFADEDPNVPVMLNSFSASISADNHVDLLWVTQSENSMLGFQLYRGFTANLEDALLASVLIPATNTSQQQVYSYLDTEVYIAGTYYYWLQSVELDGKTSFHGPISIPYTEPGYAPPYIAPQTSLGAVYPNPFNPTAFIPYEVANPVEVSFQICNSRGQLVYSVDLGARGSGHYRWEWNGRDNEGNECSNGIYLVVMSAGKEKFLRKAILCK